MPYCRLSDGVGSVGVGIITKADEQLAGLLLDDERNGDLAQRNFGRSPRICRVKPGARSHRLAADYELMGSMLKRERESKKRLSEMTKPLAEVERPSR